MIPIPDQGIRSELIAVPLVFQHFLFGGEILIILKTDLLIGLDRGLNCIYNVINCLITWFRHPIHINVPIQLFRLGAACELSEFSYQVPTLFGCDKPGGLYSVYKQF